MLPILLAMNGRTTPPTLAAVAAVAAMLCLLALSDNLFFIGELACVVVVAVALFVAIQALRADARRARWPRVIWNGPALIVISLTAVVVMLEPRLSLTGVPVGITLAAYLWYRHFMRRNSIVATGRPGSEIQVS